MASGKLSLDRLGVADLPREDAAGVAADHPSVDPGAAKIDARPVDDSLQPADSDATGIILERILPYLTNRLAHGLNQLLKEDLRQHGLSISNWRILAVLDARDRATVNELSDFAMVEQSTTSHMIDRMEADGWVIRQNAPGDARIRSVTMTEAGKRKFEEIRHIPAAHTRRALHGISPEERDAFERLLKKMTENLKRPL
ncbi:MAG: MarR family transcriptional regulator [Pseudomonadota bacterium]